MPSKHTLNVSLTAELLDFVAQQVRSGRFRTASEVVRDALRRQEAGRYATMGSADGTAIAGRRSSAPVASRDRISPSPPHRSIL
jgi:antitoxin ParD1/3/4